MPFRIVSGLLSRKPKIFQLCRKINLQEYQSKILMNEYDLAVQDFRLATSVAESECIVAAFKPPMYVLKPQILAGGRKLGHFADGFNGGIHFTTDPSEVPILVSRMLGNRLITKQTQAEGVLVNEIMIADAINLKKERYLAILLDRESNCPIIITSSIGGVNIEEIAHNTPEAIHREMIDLDKGMTAENCEHVATSLGLTPGTEQHRVTAQQIVYLYKLFTDLDCLQVEINPLGESEEGKIVHMDAKFSFDTNAAYRQPRITALAAKSRKLEIETAGKRSPEALEYMAEAHGLNYVSLSNGNIGCMVNGAGLAMATVDILAVHNGKAANFLDLSGRANQSDVEFALQTVLGDSRVKCVLINIFGGIVNCKMVAEGITSACNRLQPKVPLVIRIEGMNAVEGRKVLQDANLNMIVVNDIDEAAVQACRIANQISS